MDDFLASNEGVVHVFLKLAPFGPFRLLRRHRRRRAWHHGHTFQRRNGRNGRNGRKGGTTQPGPWSQGYWWLPSGCVKIAIENGPVEIVDLPIDSMVIFHSYSGFTHWKWWFSIVIVDLPIENGDFP